MKERPILFNTEMVKAILEGRKTQTRRVLSNQPDKNCDEAFLGLDGIWCFSKPTLSKRISYSGDDIKCPFGQVGDRLWVREAFMPDPSADSDHWNDEDSLHTYYSWDGCGSKVSELPKALKTNKHVFYKAEANHPELSLWTPNYRMPRWASRILLEITSIRAERLSNISRSDAVDEGIETFKIDCGRDGLKTAYKDYTSHNNAITRNNPIDSFRTLWESVNGADSWDKNPWVWVIDFKVAKVGGRK